MERPKKSMHGVFMTDPKKYDVTAVGNAIVDILSQVNEKVLSDLQLTKGMMTLVDLEESNRLFEAMNTTQQRSGGSAANTIAGIASFGGKCAYIGKVAEDEFGKIFRHDMHALGVAFNTAPSDTDIPTARCLSFITPDADRTMITYLGTSTELAPDDLDASKITSAKVTYLEGYLFDKELAKEAFNAASIMAHTSGGQVALTLSDPFCVNRHREDFKKLVDGHIDILFCNEEELLALYQTTDINQVIAKVADNVSICAITQGAKGATIIFNGEKTIVAAEPVVKIVDTTGAGDLFAAGFLYGYTQGMDAKTCGLLGAQAAAEIISHVGARPEMHLKELLAA
jgi:sugar/nucleoside kinase (ribokinase family)